MGKNNQFIDLTGRRFNRLLVIERTEKPAHRKSRSVYWRCMRDCGTERTVNSNSLKRGMTQSCGCLAADRTAETHKLPNMLGPKRAAFNQYRHNAKVRNREFLLSFDEFCGFIDKPCTYCGAVNVSSLRRSECKDVLYYNGIDRIDNLQGYALANCVTCCKTCNLAKRDMTHEEFVAWIRRAYLYVTGTYA